MERILSKSSIETFIYTISEDPSLEFSQLFQVRKLLLEKVEHKNFHYQQINVGELFSL